uniref:Uncharacterized protein n=1 Tax=Anguilla anguilla TaxID=7936 RepID=A0A0E9WCV4_ANGAN
MINCGCVCSSEWFFQRILNISPEKK